MDHVRFCCYCCLILGPKRDTSGFSDEEVGRPWSTLSIPYLRDACHTEDGEVELEYQQTSSCPAFPPPLHTMLRSLSSLEWPASPYLGMGSEVSIVVSLVFLVGRDTSEATPDHLTLYNYSHEVTH